MDKTGSRDGASHSEETQRKGLKGGPSFSGDPGRYVKKGFGYGNLQRGPFYS